MNIDAVAELSSGVAPTLSGEQRLARFLNAYWLRPENALWMALRSKALAACQLAGPCLDVSCGDGVFSFLHAGGVFDPSFDVFQSVARLDEANTRHADVFDHVDAGYQPRILTAPGYRLALGVDWKPSLLAKAVRLNLYDALCQHNIEHPLPFGTGAFQTIYCNCIYWVKNIGSVLAELGRLCAPGGRVILQVKLDSVLRYTLAGHRDVLGHRFLEIISRGRADTWPSLGSQQQWAQRFASAGMIVEKVTPFVMRTHAQIWDVGLRPLAPMLIKMANALTPETRASIKRDWVALLSELLLPFCDPQVDLFGGQDEPAEVQFELTRG